MKFADAHSAITLAENTFEANCVLHSIKVSTLVSFSSDALKPRSLALMNSPTQSTKVASDNVEATFDRVEQAGDCRRRRHMQALMTNCRPSRLDEC